MGLGNARGHPREIIGEFTTSRARARAVSAASPMQPDRGGGTLLRDLNRKLGRAFRWGDRKPSMA